MLLTSYAWLGLNRTEMVQGIDEGLQFLLFFLGQGLKLRPGHHGLSLLRRRYRHHLLLLTFAAAWAGALLGG